MAATIVLEMSGPVFKNHIRLAVALLCVFAYANVCFPASVVPAESVFPLSFLEASAPSPVPPALISSASVVSHLSSYRPVGREFFVSLLPTVFFRGSGPRGYSFYVTPPISKYSFLSHSRHVCRGPPRAS